MRYKIETAKIIRKGELNITSEPQYINIWGHKFTREEFDELVEVQRIPALDEVVSYWESIGYVVSVNYDNKNRITSVSQKGNGKLKHISFNWITDFIDWGQYVYSFSKDEWHGINLIIRYLEAQEEASGEKINE